MSINRRAAKKLADDIAASQKASPKPLKVGIGMVGAVLGAQMAKNKGILFNDTIGTDMGQKGKDKTVVSQVKILPGEHVQIGGITIMNNQRTKDRKTMDREWTDFVRDQSCQPSVSKHF